MRKTVAYHTPRLEYQTLSCIQHHAMRIGLATPNDYAEEETLSFGPRTCDPPPVLFLQLLSKRKG